MKKVFAILLVGIIILFTACSYDAITNGGINNENVTSYKCDVKNLRLSTTIDIYRKDEKQYTVKGDILRFVTDPLTLYDANDNKIGYAGDAYRFIAQDAHAIYVDGQTSVEMVGLVEFFGEEYDIYNFEGKKLANAKFDYANTTGIMHDVSGNVIAELKSVILMNDFTISIYNNDLLSDEQIMLIFCSYYSDQHADKTEGN